MHIKELAQSKQLAHQLGAAFFAVLTVVGASELFEDQRLAAVPVVAQTSVVDMQQNDTFARAEGKGEAARMPEEFDVGVQQAHVSGM